MFVLVVIHASSYRNLIVSTVIFATFSPLTFSMLRLKMRGISQLNAILTRDGGTLFYVVFTIKGGLSV
jgi:hypothetical protein